MVFGLLALPYALGVWVYAITIGPAPRMNLYVSDDFKSVDDDWAAECKQF